VSFSADVVPILRTCAGEICHDGTWAGPNAYTDLVGMRATECCDGRLLVSPGDPSGSYVVQKLHGVELCRGQRMPLNSSIADADVATIEDWICEGAPHN
jgi:hypothetical protein